MRKTKVSPKIDRSENGEVSINGNIVTLKGECLRIMEDYAKERGASVEEAFIGFLRERTEPNVLEWLGSFPGATDHRAKVTLNVPITLPVADWVAWVQGASLSGPLQVENVGALMSRTIEESTCDLLNSMDRTIQTVKGGAL